MYDVHMMKNEVIESLAQDLKKVAFKQGYRAYQDGLKISDNPYFTGVAETFDEELYENWIDGWYQAGADD
jgi:hypothetical protein